MAPAAMLLTNRITKCAFVQMSLSPVDSSSVRWLSSGVSRVIQTCCCTLRQLPTTHAQGSLRLWGEDLWGWWRISVEHGRRNRHSQGCYAIVFVPLVLSLLARSGVLQRRVLCGQHHRHVMRRSHGHLNHSRMRWTTTTVHVSVHRTAQGMILARRTTTVHGMMWMRMMLMMRRRGTIDHVRSSSATVLVPHWRHIPA